MHSSWIRLLAFVAMFTVTLAGCQTSGSKTILFTTSTKLGVELSAGEGNKEGVAVGYQRFAGVVMPVTKGDSGALLEEAYPVLALYDMDTGSFDFAGLGTLKVRQVFATGKAATQDNSASSVAKNLGAMTGLATDVVITSAVSIQTNIESITDDAALTRVYDVLNAEGVREHWIQQDGQGLNVTSIIDKANAKAAVAQIALRRPALLNRLAGAVESAKQPPTNNP